MKEWFWDLGELLRVCKMQTVVRTGLVRSQGGIRLIRLRLYVFAQDRNTTRSCMCH